MVLKCSLALLIAICAIWVSSCIRMANVQQFLIEVKSGSTVEEKRSIAQSIVTTERLGRLKSQVVEQMSGVSEAQLASLSLRWNVAQFRPLGNGQPQTRVTVLVAAQEAPGFNAKAVVETAGKILNGEINGSAGSSR